MNFACTQLHDNYGSQLDWLVLGSIFTRAVVFIENWFRFPGLIWQKGVGSIRDMLNYVRFPALVEYSVALNSVFARNVSKIRRNMDNLTECFYTKFHLPTQLSLKKEKA